MRTPHSVRVSVNRLRLWRRFRVAVALVVCMGAGLFVWKLSNDWAAAFCTLVGSAGAYGTVVQIGRRGIKSTRWFSSSRLATTASYASEAERFEIDLPCIRCEAANIGTEAGELDDGNIFRTCSGCGHTHWWTPAMNPPRVRRRRRVIELKPICTRCGYSLVGTPIKSETSDAKGRVFVQQCPECGRTEYSRSQGELTPPPPPL